MEKKRSWIKTIILGMIVGIALASISIYIPPTKTCYAGHHSGGDMVAAGLAGLIVGACSQQMAQDNAANRSTTVIVTDPHAGQAFYNGVWYPRERCSYDSNGQPTYCE